MSGSIANVLRRIENSNKQGLQSTHSSQPPPNKSTLRAAAATRVVEQQYHRAEEVAANDLAAALASQLSALRTTSAPSPGRAPREPVNYTGVRRLLSPVAPSPHGFGSSFQEEKAVDTTSPSEQRPRSAESRLTFALDLSQVADAPPAETRTGRARSAVVAARCMQALWRGCAVRWFIHDLSLSRLAAIVLQRWWRNERHRIEYLQDSKRGMNYADDLQVFTDGWVRDEQYEVVVGEPSVDGIREKPPPGASLDMGVWLGWLDSIEARRITQGGFNYHST